MLDWMGNATPVPRKKKLPMYFRIALPRKRLLKQKHAGLQKGILFDSRVVWLLKTQSAARQTCIRKYTHKTHQFALHARQQNNIRTIVWSTTPPTRIILRKLKRHIFIYIGRKSPCQCIYSTTIQFQDLSQKHQWYGKVWIQKTHEKLYWNDLQMAVSKK